MRRFPSIHKSEEFKAVYKMGHSHADSLLVMYVKQNGLNNNRIGISASKKVGNSVVRHRMARVLREIFRLQNPGLKQGYDIVVVVRESAAAVKFEEIAESFRKLCLRSSL